MCIRDSIISVSVHGGKLDFLLFEYSTLPNGCTVNRATRHYSSHVLNLNLLQLAVRTIGDSSPISISWLRNCQTLPEPWEVVWIFRCRVFSYKIQYKTLHAAERVKRRLKIHNPGTFNSSVYQIVDLTACVKSCHKNCLLSNFRFNW